MGNQNSTNVNSSAYLRSGDNKFEQGDYQGAVDDFFLAYHLNHDKNILHKLAVVKILVGDYKGAITDLNTVISANPQNSDAILCRGWAHHLSENNEESLKDYNEAVKLNPDDADALNARGLLYRIMGEFEKAMVDIKKSRILEGHQTEIDEDASKEYIDYALKEMKKTHPNPKTALIYCDEAIRLQHGNKTARQHRTQIYNSMNEKQKAEFDNDLLNVTALKKHASDKRKARDNAGAIEDLNKAHDLEPYDEDILHNRAIAKHRLGDVKGAILDLDAAINIGPVYAKLFINRGWAKCSLGNYDDALDDYNKALDLKPDDALALNERALIYRIKGYNEKAEADTQKARQLEDKQYASTNPYFNHPGDDYIDRATREIKENSDPIAALIFCDEAFRLGKVGPKHYNCRAQIYEHRKEYKKAEEDRLQAKLLTLKQNAFNKVELQDCVGAINDFNEMLSLRPDNAPDLYNRGLMKRNLEDFEGALEDFTAANRIDPNDNDYLTASGWVKCALGDYQGALNDYNEAHRIDPNDAFTLHGRALLYRIVGEDKKADDDMQAFNQLDDNETLENLKKKWPYEFAKCAMDIILNKTGDPKAALVYCNEAIRLKNNDPLLYSVRARIYQKMGDAEKAKLDYHHAEILKEHPNIHTQFCRGLAKRRLGDYEGAIEDYDALLRHADDIETLIERAWAKQVLGNYEGALTDYNRALELQKIASEEFDSDPEKYSDYLELYSIDDEINALECRATLYRIMGKDEHADADMQKAKSLLQCTEQAYDPLVSKEVMDCAAREMKKENGNLKVALVYCDEAIRLDNNNLNAHHYRDQIMDMAGIKTEADLLMALLNGIVYSIAKLSQKDPEEISKEEINRLERRLEILFQAIKKGIGNEAVSSDNLLDHIVSLLALQHPKDLFAQLRNHVNDFYEKAQTNCFADLDANGQSVYCILQLNIAIQFIVNERLTEIEKVKQETSSVIKRLQETRLTTQRLDEKETRRRQLELQIIIELEAEIGPMLIAINPEIFCKKLAEEQLKKYPYIKAEADILIGLLDGMLDAIHELSLKNPANITKEDIETLGAQIDILNNYFNHALYVAIQLTRIKAGRSAKKEVELGASDPLYVAMIFLSSGTTPSTEIQNKFKLLSTHMINFMNGFMQLAIGKGANYKLVNQASQGIVMLATAVDFIANQPHKLAHLSGENPLAISLVQELKTLSPTSFHDFTSSFAGDPEALAREQELAKLRYEYKRKGFQLSVKLKEKQRKKVELAAGIQQLHEHFVKELKSDDYDAQGIATIEVTKQFLMEHSPILKAQFSDNLENGIVLHICKPGYIQQSPIQYMIHQHIHTLCEAVKDSPFNLEVDEKSMVESLNIKQALKKMILDAMDEVRDELERRAKRESVMLVTQEENDKALTNRLNQKLKKLMDQLLRETITALYKLYAEKYFNPNMSAFKEFAKLLIQHASNKFPQTSTVTLNEETHKFSYDNNVSLTVHEGDYSDPAIFKITHSIIKHANTLTCYLENYLYDKSKIKKLFRLAMLEEEHKAPSQIEKHHLVGQHCTSLLMDSQKAFVHEKLNQYPDGCYSKKALSEDFPYGIIKNNGQYFVVYEGQQKNKHLGTGTNAKAKLAQHMDDDKWFTLKVFGDETLACKELQKLIKLNKTPQKYLFAKQGKPFGKIHGQKKYYVLLEYAHGEELERYIGKNRHRLSDIDLIVIACGMIQAVWELHKTHFHCDIKPKNFVFDEKNEITKIIDFGSIVERGIANHLLGSDVKGEIAGTEGYMTQSIISDMQRGETHTYYSINTEMFALACAFEQLFLNRKKYPDINKFVHEMKHVNHKRISGEPLLKVMEFFTNEKFDVVTKSGTLTVTSSSSLQWNSMFRNPELTYLERGIIKLVQKRQEERNWYHFHKNAKTPYPYDAKAHLQKIMRLDDRINTLQTMHDTLLNSLKASSRGAVEELDEASQPRHGLTP